MFDPQCWHVVIKEEAVPRAARCRAALLIGRRHRPNHDVHASLAFQRLRGSRAPQYAPEPLACPARCAAPLARQRCQKIVDREVDKRVLAAAVDPDQRAAW